MEFNEAIKAFKESEKALAVAQEHIEHNADLYQKIQREHSGVLALIQTLADVENQPRDEAILAGFAYGLYVGMTRKQ